MIKITIPLPPITKKNSQRIIVNSKTGRPFIMPSEQFKQYENKALWYIPKGANIDKPVNVKCLFYMPTRRKCDLTNLLEAIDDILVKAGVLADDNYTIIQSHDGSRVYYDKENPRTEIYITGQTNGTNEELIKLMCSDDFNKFLFRFKVDTLVKASEGKAMDAVEQNEWLQSQDHSLLFELMNDE